MRLAHADDVVVLLPPQEDFDRVLRVEREEVPDQRAALRAERLILAEPFVLHERLGNLERVDDRIERRIADGEAAQRPRGRQIVLEQRRRDREHARHVVEAFLIGFVRREQRASVDLEAEQIANRVSVLAAIQSMHGNAARMRLRRGGRVELALERRGDGAIGVGARARPARRRHLARAQFGDDLLPLLRVVGDAGRIEAVELQAGGFQPTVVAGDTVFIENVARGNRGRARLHRVRTGEARAQQRHHCRQRPRTCRCSCHHMRRSGSSMP